ncbi:MAG: HK97 family phage prohead protease [Candidatus Nanopelagicales bacterium]
MIEIREAALARSRSVEQLSHRPSQRRCAQEQAARAVMRAPLATLEIRSDEDDADVLHFAGVASATERAYEMWDMFGPYSEIVAHDAFAATLAREDLDVPLVLAHDQMRRIARTTLGTLRLSMTEPGLTVEADLDRRDLDVQYIEPKLRAGLIDEMSFAFRIVSGQWSPDYTEYRITEVDIHRGDVAIVGWGANPHTTAELRHDDPRRGSVAAYLDAVIAAPR